MNSSPVVATSMVVVSSAPSSCLCSKVELSVVAADPGDGTIEASLSDKDHDHSHDAGSHAAYP